MRLAAPGAGFGEFGAGYVRFSLTEPDSVLKEALRRIKSLAWPAARKAKGK